MNGFDFNLRVLQPWSRDPGFYSIIPRFQYTQAGAFRIPSLPLLQNKVDEFETKLKAVPKILQQAKNNLTKPASDLALLAIKRKKEEINLFHRLKEGLEKHHPRLVPEAENAIQAMEDFSLWLKKNKDEMEKSAGIGKENYNWYLKNVQLVPYTWEEARTLIQREYERALTCLKLEENKNHHLPPLKPAATEEEFKHRFNRAQKFLLDFLNEEKIFTVPDYLVLNPLESLKLPKKPFNFFQQCQIRDPLPLMPHDFVGHSLDAERHSRDERPIRGVDFIPYMERRLFFIDAFRNEGLATGMEEILMHAGLLDNRPRSREITYILLAFRTVRAAADLKMHSNQFSLKEALQYCEKQTPRGWARADSSLLWGDLELYLRQPGYGISYLIGKLQLEKLMAERAYQLGRDFGLQQFMDEFLKAGQIPISLIRWEMTGLDDELEKLWP